ncbi:MAG TPA: hypothetical protein VIK02_07255 [Candidatus Anoxymicrobiaceae bacterium]
MNLIYESALGGTGEHEGQRQTHDMLERWGESHVFGIDDARVEEFMTTRGFINVENPSPESLEETYFKPAGRDEKIAGSLGIVCATVARQSS